ncbi:hypothetical protein [Virgibacillus doumboii]|uniref:hypothetical protein n=1 Tax=Virgibacillus doumboii TaxID=2697503 RepID=UPI0013E05D60|nr:hypothetical protein [Virgibacillus doumboii]
MPKINIWNGAFNWFLARLAGFLARLAGFLARLAGFLARLAGFLARLAGFLARLAGFLARLAGFLARLAGFLARLDVLHLRYHSVQNNKFILIYLKIPRAAILCNAEEILYRFQIIHQY